MSKKYKGKRCVYCGVQESTTADHVVCREFFPAEQRDGLPQAPACSDCNTHKSKLEHYLTSLLPFGARDETGSRMLRTKVGRRLDKNERLRRSLQKGMRPVNVAQDGVERPTSSVPFDGEQYLRLCRLIIRGLVWWEWNHVVPREHSVRAVAASEVGRVFFQDLLAMSPKLQVNRSLAGGAFTYRATRSSEDAAFTAWEFAFYGGALMAGVDADGRLIPLSTYGLSGPQEIEEEFDRVMTGNKRGGSS